MRMTDYMKEAGPDGWRNALQKLSGLRSFLAGWKLSESCIRNDMGTEVSRWIDGLSELYGLYSAAPAPDHFRDAAKMAPAHCTPTEHDGRIVYEHTSEPIPNADGFVLYAAPAPDRFRAAAKMMAVQPACMTCSGHGMVGGLLPNGGGYQADPCPDCAAPVTAGVPMPKPVAYGFGNTAITGHTNRLMMVRIDIPGGDQYAGAFWLPLVLADEAHAYGVACRAAGEAAGYARGRVVEKALRGLLNIIDDSRGVDGYHLNGDIAEWDDFPEVEAAKAALRGEVKP